MYLNHYRPVSLSCMLSKVSDKIMYDRLSNFVNKHDLLYAHQYGFQKKTWSTYVASLIDYLTHALENWEYAVGVYLYFSNAFDMVDYIILLQKLYHCGDRGCAHDWLTSYLSTDHSLLHIMVSNLVLKLFNVVYHKGLFWVHFSFLYISMTWLMPVIEYFQFYLLMIQIYS